MFKKTFISVLSITSVVSSMALAQLTPGPGHGGGGSKPPHYDPCNQPSDPNCHGGGGHGGGHGPGPGHGGGGHNPPPSGPITPGPSHPPGGGGYPYPNDPYDPNPGYPYPSDPYPNDPYYPGPSSSIFRTIDFYRSVTNQTIDLRRLAGLDYRYQGYRIVSVSASTTPNSPFTTIAQLIVDGYVYASQTNPGHEIHLFPYYEARIDRNAGRVFLGVQGSTYINQIRIELSRY